MNKLPLAKRAQIIAMMVEGSSMRSISRVCDVSINTVAKMLVDAGETCLDLHDRLVRDVRSERIECDEIWSFIHTRSARKPKAKAPAPEHGDVWTWTAIDTDTKLMVSYLAGARNFASGEAFMQDLASRMSDTFQLTTDGFPVYPKAVAKVFGDTIDHATLVKIYSSVKTPGQTRYAPLECVGVKKDATCGSPDLERASTSIVERANLSMRMGMRRYTRLTNAHSKKLRNHVYALAIFFMHYNFVRQHKTLRTSPAMAAGLADRLWSVEDIVAAMDERAGPAKKRGPYKKRAA